MEYHVSKSGNDCNRGTEETPFLTISKAAEIANPGDIIIVHGGEYRENVSPSRGGSSEINRIIYQAAEGEHVVIKGSEMIKGWIPISGIWMVVLDNQLFGSFNPFQETLHGDWLIAPYDRTLHLGEVYLNGKQMYEAASIEAVKKHKQKENGEKPFWMTWTELPLQDPEDSVYQWYAEVNEKNTTIYANFEEYNPNEELVEINDRKTCFYPEKAGCNYITVKGFEMAQAATPWAPPTADQPGLIGPHWSKGWIIEENVIHDSRCNGISLGKDETTGDNESTMYHRKPGYLYQMEVVMRALKAGWSKEKVGSHIIRNNVIYNCGQTGIVGHLGCVFSQIEHNHIYNIAMKREWYGYEIAGIKLHAAIDVQLKQNCIHHTALGTWLDWEAQGTRITGNLYYANDRDFMIEVTHGPCMMDHNIFGSSYNLENVAQGTAFLHNLFLGPIRRAEVMDRTTPYHLPHSTDIAGVSFVYSGDDRCFQNIYLGGEKVNQDTVGADTKAYGYGTEGYNGSPSSMEAYVKSVCDLGNEDHIMFNMVDQPVYIDGNVYLNGAKPYENENNQYCSTEETWIAIQQEADGVYLETELPEAFFHVSTKCYETKDLGFTRVSDGIFDDPEGQNISFSVDYFGTEATEAPLPGPINSLRKGKNRIKIW